MAAYAASSLDSPSHYGADAASTLAIALSLAASGIEPVQGISGDCAPYEPFASLLVRMSEWIVAWFGDPIDRYTAATLAASCLTASPDPQLASLGELLVCWAEEFTLD